MPVVKLLSENPEPRWAKYAIVYQGRQQLFRSRAEAVAAATRIRNKGIEVQVMAIRERVKNPKRVSKNTKSVYLGDYSSLKFEVSWIRNSKKEYTMVGSLTEAKAIASAVANKYGIQVKIKEHK